jgi:hypothetical protein
MRSKADSCVIAALLEKNQLLSLSSLFLSPSFHRCTERINSVTIFFSYSSDAEIELYTKVYIAWKILIEEKKS